MFVIRLLGAGVALFGLYLSWFGAPMEFEDYSGHALPEPIVENASSMAVWGGVSFLRMTGVAVLGIGAVLLASGNRRNYAVMAALSLTMVWGIVIAFMQQVSIWSGSGGWVFMTLFGTIATACGWSALSDWRAESSNAAAGKA